MDDALLCPTCAGPLTRRDCGDCDGHGVQFDPEYATWEDFRDNNRDTSCETCEGHGHWFVCPDLHDGPRAFTPEEVCE